MAFIMYWDGAIYEAEMVNLSLSWYLKQFDRWWKKTAGDVVLGDAVFEMVASSSRLDQGRCEVLGSL